MVSEFEMIPLILLTFFQAISCGGSALRASMQEWRAGLSPEFYLMVINSKWHIPFYAVVKGILFKQSSVSHAVGSSFLEVSIYLFISGARIIGVAGVGDPN